MHLMMTAACCKTDAAFKFNACPLGTSREKQSDTHNKNDNIHISELSFHPGNPEFGQRHKGPFCQFFITYFNSLYALENFHWVTLHEGTENHLIVLSNRHKGYQLLAKLSMGGLPGKGASWAPQPMIHSRFLSVIYFVR